MGAGFRSADPVCISRPRSKDARGDVVPPDLAEIREFRLEDALIVVVRAPVLGIHEIGVVTRPVLHRRSLVVELFRDVRRALLVEHLAVAAEVRLRPRCTGRRPGTPCPASRSQRRPWRAQRPTPPRSRSGTSAPLAISPRLPGGTRYRAGARSFNPRLERHRRRQQRRGNRPRRPGRRRTRSR